MRRPASLLAILVGSLAVAAPGRAADQLVLGDEFILFNPGPEQLRTAVATAEEHTATATIVGDPTLPGSAGGAILTLIANGASSSSQSFVLPQGASSSGRPFWRAIAGGFRYVDLTGQQGPVTAVVIKRTSGGRFVIESTVLGLNGPVEVVPPNPGTDAFMTLKLGLAPEAGDRYCVQYGPESRIRNIGPFFFSARDPVEKGCPPTEPTTTTTTAPTTTTTTTTQPDVTCSPVGAACGSCGSGLCFSPVLGATTGVCVDVANSSGTPCGIDPPMPCPPGEGCLVVQFSPAMFVCARPCP
jgi:hypothetical protein